MKPMSSRQVRNFWTYLHNETERYRQKFLEAGDHHAFKDEMRAAGEIYAWLAAEFAGCLGAPLNAAIGIHSGLTAGQVTAFLSMLDQKIADGKAWQEQNMRKRQAALEGLDDAEYFRVRHIYKGMNNLAERQTWCYEQARERLLSILKSESTELALRPRRQPPYQYRS